MSKTKVRIVWNGSGGELDSVVVLDDDEQSITDALIGLVSGNVVSAGDSFTVQEIE